MINKNFIISNSKEYISANPFPHCEIKNLWDENYLNDILKEFERFNNWDGVVTTYGAQSKKFCYSPDKLPKKIFKFLNYLNDKNFISIIENITGEKNLIPDNELKGAGMAQIGKGGFLKMHADFTWHSELKLYRKINLLIYLNKNWDEKWGGDLQLASKIDDKLSIEKNIYPHFNTTVIFTTNDNSFHGHPNPLNCPKNVYRNSISTYYYVKEKPTGIFNEKRTATDYRKLSGKKIVRDPIIKIVFTNPKRVLKWFLKKIKIIE